MKHTSTKFGLFFVDAFGSFAGRSGRITPMRLVMKITGSIHPNPLILDDADFLERNEQSYNAASPVRG